MKLTQVEFSTKRKRKAVILNFFLVISCMLIFFISSCSQQKKPIKIGGILCLSGPGAYLQAVRDGMVLAIDEVNKAGGINGRKIELYVEDSKTNPEEGKRAFQKLEKEQHPLLYVVNMSPVAMVVRDMAEEAKAPMIATPSSATALTAGKEWIFRYWVSAREDIPPIVNILNMLKVNTVGMLYLQGPYGASLLQILEEDSRKVERTVVSVPFKADETQFKEQIEKVINTDAIYVGGYSSHMLKIFSQIRAAGYRGHLVAATGASEISLRKDPVLNGVYLASPLIYNQAFPYAKELSEKYEAKYHIPLSHYAAIGYDMIKLLEDLLPGKEMSRENVKKVLEQGFHYPSSMGDINVDPGSHEIQFRLYPAQIRGGKIYYLNNL